MCVLNLVLDSAPFNLSDVMLFLSGSARIPPLGLAQNIKVIFKHDCDVSCQCKPRASTCSLNLFLPIHYDSEEKMIDAWYQAIKCSVGFDNV